MINPRLRHIWDRTARHEAREIYGDGFVKHQAEYCTHRVEQLERQYKQNIKTEGSREEDVRLFEDWMRKIGK